jgi:hypothetical protein
VEDEDKMANEHVSDREEEEYGQGDDEENSDGE